MGASRTPSGKGGSKKSKKEQDIDSAIKEVDWAPVLAKTTRLKYGAIGIYCAALPFSLFMTTIFDQPLRVTTVQGFAQFLIVSIVAGMMLATAYTNVCYAKARVLVHQRCSVDVQGVTKQEKERLKVGLTEATMAECENYALFTVNLVFLFMFLTLAFWAIPKVFFNIRAQTSHLVAVGIPPLFLASYGKSFLA